MKFLDITMNDAAEDVALDEALLEYAEAGKCEDEVLRIWQPEFPIVVLGRSSPVAREVNVDYCRTASIPIIRRCSGGSTIVTGHGCLMYAVLLDYRQRPELRAIDNAHQFVMQRIQRAILTCGVETKLQGICDLTINDKKVSGNALRCKKDWCLYHGTLIYDRMDLSLISKCLGIPDREPDYRNGRSHLDFLTRIPTDADTLVVSLKKIWNCEGVLHNWPDTLMGELASSKYSEDAWNFKI